MSVTEEHRRVARELLDRYIETAADTGACPHCGEVWTNEMLRDDKRIPTHDYPKPCRQVCPGSGQFPVPDATPLRDAIATALANERAVAKFDLDAAKERATLQEQLKAALINAAGEETSQ